MDRRGLLFIFPFLLFSGATAQYWAPLRNGIKRTPGSVFTVYGDSVWDRLLVGTSVKWIIEGDDSLLIRGGASWDGVIWDSLPAPLGSCPNGNTCSAVNRFFRFRNKLYAAGSFNFLTPEGVPNSYIARWSEADEIWEALECTNPYPGMITMLHVPPNDTMYFTGYMGSVCGFPESCVFAYDGNGFQAFEPFNDWPGVSGDYVGFVFRFQGQLYMTGLLDNSITGTFHGFLRHTGNAWEAVPGFETPAPIKDVLIHDDKLYVCGYFFTNTGGPGNMVTVYNGEEWSDMGGGLRYALPNSTSGIAMDLHEWNGDIYVAGQFNYSGGVYAENVARWNGQQWCGLGGAYANFLPGGTVLGVTNWRDSLYIAGGFVTIDGDTLHNVARWLGVVENCSPALEVEEARLPSGLLIPVLLDAGGIWRIDLPEPAVEVRLHDARGRLVHQLGAATQHTMTVDLAARAAGIYVVVCTTSAGAVYRAKVYKP